MLGVKVGNRGHGGGVHNPEKEGGLLRTLSKKSDRYNAWERSPALTTHHVDSSPNVFQHCAVKVVGCIDRRIVHSISAVASIHKHQSISAGYS